MTGACSQRNIHSSVSVPNGAMAGCVRHHRQAEPHAPEGLRRSGWCRVVCTGLAVGAYAAGRPGAHLSQHVRRHLWACGESVRLRRCISCASSSPLTLLAGGYGRDPSVPGPRCGRPSVWRQLRVRSESSSLSTGAYVHAESFCPKIFIELASMSAIT